jgi:hypothetical protein
VGRGPEHKERKKAGGIRLGGIDTGKVSTVTMACTASESLWEEDEELARHVRKERKGSSSANLSSARSRLPIRFFSLSLSLSRMRGAALRPSLPLRRAILCARIRCRHRPPPPPPHPPRCRHRRHRCLCRCRCRRCRRSLFVVRCSFRPSPRPHVNPLSLRRFRRCPGQFSAAPAAYRPCRWALPISLAKGRNPFRTRLH